MTKSEHETRKLRRNRKLKRPFPKSLSMAHAALMGALAAIQTASSQCLLQFQHSSKECGAKSCHKSRFWEIHDCLAHISNSPANRSCALHAHVNSCNYDAAQDLEPARASQLGGISNLPLTKTDEKGCCNPARFRYRLNRASGVTDDLSSTHLCHEMHERKRPATFTQFTTSLSHNATFTQFTAWENRATCLLRCVAYNKRKKVKKKTE